MSGDIRGILGKQGEEQALNYLLSLNYILIDKNYILRDKTSGKKLGEIDLIMRDKDELVFVEVRTRHINDTETPLESIDKFKRRQIERCAKLYIMYNDISDLYMRFDCVGITINEKNVPNIEHIQNAFLCGE